MVYQNRTALPALTIGMLLMAMACSRHTSLGFGLDTMAGSKDTARYPSARIERALLPSMKIVGATFEVER